MIDSSGPELKENLLMINKIILGNALNILKTLPAESVNCVVTSPPYWSLRDYQIEPVIWDGVEGCKHEFNNYNSKLLHENRQNLDGGTIGNPKYRENLHGFGNAKAGFCLKCGAWRGSLGLEPTFDLYIKHLCDIFDEVKRVLRKDGTCWVNMGDSYAGSGKAGSNPEYQNGHTEFGKPSTHSERFGMPTNKINYPNKSLCLIPQRFVIEMVNRGWIAHNELIWHKPNCMPSSAKKRFTVDFEPVFFFSKSNKTLFWTNEKTLECISKKPLGIKGIEGKDWEWRSCPKCHGKGNVKNKICPKCKGLRKVKYSLWKGHDYWFEQQFEEGTGRSSGLINPVKGAGTKGFEIRNGFHKCGNKEWHNRNKRAVWIIPTQPFPEAHFAVYSEGLIEIPIKAGCPEFICKKCGMARVKILDNSGRINTRPGLDTGNMKSGKDIDPNKELHKSDLSKYRQQINYKEIGYSDCGCHAGFESGIVLDPFMGAGTTALVALKQRKRFIGIEIKQEYIDMAKKRIARVQQRIF